MKLFYSSKELDEAKVDAMTFSKVNGCIAHVVETATINGDGLIISEWANRNERIKATFIRGQKVGA